MICPGCDKDVNVQADCGLAVEPHGERHWEEWGKCPACGEKFGWDEIDQANKETK